MIGLQVVNDLWGSNVDRNELLGRSIRVGTGNFEIQGVVDTDACGEVPSLAGRSVPMSRLLRGRCTDMTRPLSGRYGHIGLTSDDVVSQCQFSARSCRKP